MYFLRFLYANHLQLQIFLTEAPVHILGNYFLVEA